MLLYNSKTKMKTIRKKKVILFAQGWILNGEREGGWKWLEADVIGVWMTNFKTSYKKVAKTYSGKLSY